MLIQKTIEHIFLGLLHCICNLAQSSSSSAQQSMTPLNPNQIMLLSFSQPLNSSHYTLRINPKLLATSQLIFFPFSLTMFWPHWPLYSFSSCQANSYFSVPFLLSSWKFFPYMAFSFYNWNVNFSDRHSLNIPS